MSRLNLAVGLPLRNRQDLDTFLEQVSDPHSPNYRRYLSADEFAERFGPTQDDYDKLAAFFRANGFAVTGTHPNRMILDVAGPVSAIDKTLHINMTAWEHQTRGRFFAPDRDPSLDADVTVLDIAGLDNFVLPRALHVTMPLASHPLSGSGPDGLYAGSDFRAAYAPGVTLTGAGQTVGLFELDGFFAADVVSNFQQAALPPVPVSTVLLDGFSGAPGNENVEVILDIVMAGYMAPGASVMVYEGSAPNDVLNRMATDNIAKQLSCSWVFDPINATTEQIFTEMIAQGQSFLQASGDSGAYGPSNTIWPPADDPNVTVVGGTALSTAGPAGAWVSESAWNDGGGGVSVTYPIPSYQQGVNMAAIGGSNSMRNIPDVSSVAAIQIFLICNNGQWISVGGTSAAAPLWAGFIALANQQAVASGNPVAGFLNPTLYAIGNGTAYATALHDITAGSNGFATAAGYDLATGWGTPAGQPLINDLSASPSAPSFGLSATPTAVSVADGSSASSSIQIAAHNGFSGAVTLSVSGLPSGVTGTLGAVGNGASQLTLAASGGAVPGNYSISVKGVSGALTASVGLTLQVTGVPSYTLQATPAAVSIVQGGAATASIAIQPTNGFNSAVNLTVSGLPSGVTASFSPASASTVSTLSFAAGASAALGAATVTVTGKSGSLSATAAITLTVAPPANFTLAASSSALSVARGAGATDTIAVTTKTGFSGTVALSVAGLPSGVTAAFNPSTTATSSTVTLSAAPTAALGTATVTVTGSQGASSASATIALTVAAAPSFTLAAAPATVSVSQGTSGTSTITITPQNGFTGAASLSIAGLPTGITAAFSPASATSTSTLTLTAGASASIGTATATITATSGGISATASLALTVTAAVPGFNLTSSATNVNVATGGAGTATIGVQPLGGFSGTVALAASGLPAGVTASFSPASTASTSILTLTAASSAALGGTQVTIKGTSSNLTGAVTITVTVTPPPPPSFTLTLAPASLSMGQGTSVTSALTVTPANGFAGAVSLAIAGLPTGVTATFGPASATSTSTLTLTAGASAPLGTSTVTITGTSAGTSGSISAGATLALTLAAPTFSLAASPATLSVGQGMSATSTVTVTPLNGFTGAVSLSIAGLPTGVTAVFNPASTKSTSTLTLTAAASAPLATEAATITGTYGSISARPTLNVTVAAPGVTLAAAPASLSIIQGTAGTSTVTVTPMFGFTGPVSLSIAGLPTGVTAAFSPASASSTSTLTLTAAASATTGTATATVTATSGGISAKTTVALTIAVAPSFTLAAAPASLTVGQGATGTSTITVTPANGFSGPVSLAVAGLPTGVTAAFSPASATSTSTLTFTAGAAASIGTATVTVTGTSGSISAKTTVALTVAAPSFTLAAAPASLSVAPGASGTSTVTVTPLNGFSGAVGFAVAGLPTGVTAAFSPASATSTSTLTLTAAAAASIGTATLTVTGTSGNISAKATVTLTVAAPSFTLAAAPASLNIMQGTTGTSTVTVTPSNGFTGAVSLAVAGLPTGVTAAFSPASATSTSTLTFTAGAAASTGPATVTVTGTSGNISAKATVAITVAASGPSFALTAAPASLNVTQGAAGSSTITLVPLNGFTGNVNLAIAGVPAGVTSAFSPGATGASLVLTLTAGGSAPAGTATVTLTGTCGGLSATVTIALTVTAAAPGFNLVSSAPNVNVAPGGSGAATINIQPLGGFAGTVALTASGLPTGVTASFSPASTGSASALTLKATASAAVGVSLLTIKGASGSLSATLTMTVAVTATPPPNFAVTLAPASLSLVQGATGAIAVTVAGATGTAGNVVLSAVGLPAGVTASFSPLSGAGIGPGVFMATFTAGASAAAGTSRLALAAISGNVSQSAVLSLTVVAPSAGTVAVNLSPYYNVTGSAVDLLPFATGGLDGGGRSYSGLLLGASQNVGGTVFSLGPMAAPDAVSGQTVTLPAGNFTALSLLATGVNGSQSGQTFLVTYTDGTTASFTQSLSDWCASQNYPGELQSVPMSYRDNSTGTVDVRTLYLYGYSFTLNGAKTVKSIALPQNRNVVVMAITLI
jgi:uncharacterized membrane protein